MIINLIVHLGIYIQTVANLRIVIEKDLNLYLYYPVRRMKANGFTGMFCFYTIFP